MDRESIRNDKVPLFDSFQTFVLIAVNQRVERGMFEYKCFQVGIIVGNNGHALSGCEVCSYRLAQAEMYEHLKFLTVICSLHHKHSRKLRL